MRSMKPVFAVLGVTSMLFSPVALHIPFIGATAAFAGNGNGNGGGNGSGGGNGNGHSNNGGNSHSAAGASSGSASTDVTSVEKPGKAKGSHGLLASELKGLNAAHASPNALANASPNSQVGRLATYRDAALAAAGAQDAIDQAVAALSEFDTANPGRSVADIEADITALDPAAVGYDPAQLDALNAELDNAQMREADRTLLADAVTGAEAAAEGAALAEAEALLDAANGRTLSPEAVAYVRDLLNI